jgi:hypothetical protein
MGATSVAETGQLSITQAFNSGRYCSQHGFLVLDLQR